MHGNPVNYADPSGQCVGPLIILCIAGIVAGVAVIADFSLQTHYNMTQNDMDFWNAVGAQNHNWNQTAMYGAAGGAIGLGIGGIVYLLPYITAGGLLLGTSVGLYELGLATAPYAAAATNAYALQYIFRDIFFPASISDDERAFATGDFAYGYMAAYEMTARAVTVNNWVSAAEEYAWADIQQGIRSINLTSGNPTTATVAADFYVTHAGTAILGDQIGNPGVVTYYRVQGGIRPTASRPLIRVDAQGNVRISTTHSLNISDYEHARYFLANRRPGGHIVAFDIPTWLDDFMVQEAIPSFRYTTNPLNQGGTAPKIMDPNQPGVSYELVEPWLSWFNEYAIRGSILTGE